MPLFQSNDPNTLSDAELIALHRGGDQRAYAQLWERHYSAGVKAARAITGSHDPDDLVQESFTRILSTLSNGKGPSENFRAYLYATIRSVSISWSGKIEPTIDITTAETALVSDEDLMAVSEDKRLTIRAFKDLPEDWRTVLWYTEIEGMTPAEIAPLMGLSARAVSALSFRAREGLRESWLSAHLPASGAYSSEDCKWTEKHLSSYSRGSLTPKRTTRLEDHLRDCTKCSILLAELNLVGRDLRAALLPLFLGIAPAALDKLLPFVAAGGTGLVATSSQAPTGLLTGVRTWGKSNQGVVIAGGAVVAAVAVAAMALNSQSDTKPVAEEPASASPTATEPLEHSAQVDASPSATAEDSAEEPEASPTDLPVSLHTPDAAQPSSPRAPSRPSSVPTPSASPTDDDSDSTPSQPSAEPSKEPTVKPTNEPTEEPTVDPTVDPTDEPTDEPTEEPETALEITEVSDSATTDLMPRVSGTAAANSEVQLFDAANPSVAVSERIAVKSDSLVSGTVALADSSTTSVAGPAQAIGTWTLDVLSTAPTGRGLTYVVKNFVDGKLVSSTPVGKSFTIAALDTSEFAVCDLEDLEGTTGIVPNGGTLVRAGGVDGLSIHFTVVSEHPATFQFNLNGVQRTILQQISESGTWKWVPADNSVPLRETGNTIGLRIVDTAASGGARYGPLATLFTFDVSMDPAHAPDDPTAGACPPRTP